MTMPARLLQRNTCSRPGVNNDTPSGHGRTMTIKAPSQVRVRKSHCRSLPPEVWINIFSFHTELTHLWTVCRRVSTTLRACAEYAFAEYFLSDVYIDFQLEKYNLGGRSKRPEIPVSVDKVGKRDDKHIAWFSDKRPKSELYEGSGKKARDHYEMVMQRWEDNVKGWKPEMPNYTINIRGVVNDTALPGLEIDPTSRSITFDWKEMLQLFYREQARLQALKQVWQVKTAEKMRANNARLAKGEKLMPADYPQAWPSAEAEIRKEVRRARLKEYYSDDEQMLWAIDSLKRFEQYGSASGNAKALKLDPDLPGAGLGEKWFGRANLVQELYLDEWSCMHRIDTKVEHLRGNI